MVDTEDRECKNISDEDDINGGCGDNVMSHQEAMEQFKDALAEIVVGDALLSDLHTEVTLDEVNSHIQVEHGQAITINVRRGDDVILPVTIVQNSTVFDLKKAIQRHMILRQARQNGTKHISWRYVWKRHLLYFDGQKLVNDRKPIKDYGLRNKDEITFIRRLKQK